MLPAATRGAPRPLPILLATLLLAALCSAAERGAPEADRGGPGTAAGALDGLPEDPATAAPTGEAGAQALERGLAWLAAGQAQQRDGSLPQAGGSEFAPVAVTALGALAFMAAGSSPDRGPHGQEVSAAIDYLLLRCDLNESAEGGILPEAHGFISADGDNLSRMHGHGFATLAMAQAYSQSPRSRRGKRLERALEASVALIARTQSPQGGWYYYPERGTDDEGSITICLVQALRSARNAGIHVDKRVIDRAVSYVERSQKENGMFRYSLTRDRTSVALTAAAVATLNATGQYSGQAVERGLFAIRQELLQRETARHPPKIDFPFYERFYLSQALWQHADLRPFQEWNARETQRLLTRQEPDGSWKDSRYGRSYATAMSCLVLALPAELLPIFQR